MLLIRTGNRLASLSTLLGLILASQKAFTNAVSKLSSVRPGCFPFFSLRRGMPAQSSVPDRIAVLIASFTHFISSLLSGALKDLVTTSSTSPTLLCGDTVVSHPTLEHVVSPFVSFLPKNGSASRRLPFQNHCLGRSWLNMKAVYSCEHTFIGRRMSALVT